MWKQWQSGRELGLFARIAGKGWRDKGVKVVCKNNFRVIGAVQTGRQVLKFPVLKEELSQGSKVRREEGSKPSFGQLQHLMSGWDRQWRLSDYRGGYQKVLVLEARESVPRKWKYTCHLLLGKSVTGCLESPLYLVTSKSLREFRRVRGRSPTGIGCGKWMGGWGCEQPY